MFRSLKKLLDLAPLGMCNQLRSILPLEAGVLQHPVIPPTPIVLYPASPAQLLNLLPLTNYLKELGGIY